MIWNVNFKFLVTKVWQNTHHANYTVINYKNIFVLLFLLLGKHGILICQSDKDADKGNLTRTVSKEEVHLDVLHGLAEGDPLVGRLPPQLLHHLPLLLNTSRHSHFKIKLWKHEKKIQPEILRCGELMSYFVVLILLPVSGDCAVPQTRLAYLHHWVS